VPHDRTRLTMDTIGEKVRQLRRNNEPLFLLGDWNQRKETLTEEIAKWGVDAAKVPVKGDEETWNGFFVPGRSRTAIDHVVQVGGSHSGSVKVKQGYTDSDHWPMKVRIQLGENQREEQENLSRMAIRKAATRISNDPLWDAEIDSAKELREMCMAVAAKHQCMC
ncbi:MAG: uncharacterized protein A8A55_3548, partial [Amphiamblys sp. WSBS2006]